MSSENVEIVRRATEAAYRKPKPDFETVNALYDPDHELIALLSQLEGHSFRGAVGFRDWMAFMDESWERWGARLERVEDVDDDRVLVISLVSGRSRLGGAPFEQRFGFIVTVRNGKVVLTEAFGSAEEARAAAGVP